MSHKRNSSFIPPAPISEDLEGQIDRLNQALNIAIQEIELNAGSSRAPSRVSVVHSEIYIETNSASPSNHSEDMHFPAEFEEKIEELILASDRDKMTIEDFWSNECRRLETEATTGESCTYGHDALKMKNEIELALKMQKNLRIEAEKKNFEEKLALLDALKEEYMKKKAEVFSTHEKLMDKEALLDQKEKELRASRMAFERHRMLWQQEHEGPHIKGNKENCANPELPYVKPARYVNNKSNPLRSSMPVADFNALNFHEHSENPKDPAPGAASLSIEACQEQLKNKELELNHYKKAGLDTSKLELQVDSLKNKIAALRGEKVLQESSQATKLMSNIMLSFKKQSIKEEATINRSELFERMKQKELVSKPIKEPELAEGFKLKQLEQKAPEPSETTRRFLFSDAPTPKGIQTPRTAEKEDPYKAYFENRKKMLVEKEKELKQQELFLQQTWMKLPGAKELIDNVNLALGKVSSEKASIEALKDELEKERLEFIRYKEKIMAQMKKEEKSCVIKVV